VGSIFFHRRIEVKNKLLVVISEEFFYHLPVNRSLKFRDFGENFRFCYTTMCDKSKKIAICDPNHSPFVKET